ncbi:MAG: M23 family metallopeptidase [candidate division NC10 bacterium]|nr:M23 family metallopeptidase [candidate division NC10 bacterium]
MAPRFFTILVLTDGTTRPHQVRVALRTLGIVLAGVVVLTLLFTVVGYRALTREVDYQEFASLRAAVQAQHGMAAQLETLQQELSRLRTFDTQIRRLAGLDTAPRGSTLAVGGGTLELSKALKASEEAETGTLLQRLVQDLERLEREVALRGESLQAVQEYLTKQKDRLTATPSLWPTEGQVTSRFGPRTSPFTGQPQHHTGVDIAAPPGTPIRAPAAGVVTFAGTLPGYGTVVVLTHGFGYKTFYGHNQRNVVVKGQAVARGQQIAAVGNTGYSTGAHLHYEVLLNDAPHDPLKYIVDEERRATVIRGQ